MTISAENDQGDPCIVTITDARQDEPVNEPGAGAGNTSPDAAMCGDAGNESTVQLRGERNGTGRGRYDHIVYTMADPDCAQPAADEARILVPHDQGSVRMANWVDEGSVFASYEDATLVCSQ